MAYSGRLGRALLRKCQPSCGRRSTVVDGDAGRGHHKGCWEGAGIRRIGHPQKPVHAAGSEAYRVCGPGKALVFILRGSRPKFVFYKEI